MMAVIVSGESGTILDYARSPYVGCLADISLIEFKKGGKFFGVFSRVATQLGVSPTSVRGVALGKSKSSRVRRALEIEVKRIRASKLQAVRPDPISPNERQQFSRKYSGIYKRVARLLNCSDGWIYEVARGRYYDARVIGALRKEMAIADARIVPQRLTTEELAQCKRGARYAGVFNTVAKRLGVCKTMPAAIARGAGKSERVLTAIRAEMRLIDSALGPELEQISDAERSKFRRGERYYGLIATVARATGHSRGTVSSWIGRRKCPHAVLRQTRNEMARVDAEISAKGGAA